MPPPTSPPFPVLAFSLLLLCLSARYLRTTLHERTWPERRRADNAWNQALRRQSCLCGRPRRRLLGMGDKQKRWESRACVSSGHACPWPAGHVVHRRTQAVAKRMESSGGSEAELALILQVSSRPSPAAACIHLAASKKNTHLRAARTQFTCILEATGKVPPRTRCTPARSRDKRGQLTSEGRRARHARAERQAKVFRQVWCIGVIHGTFSND